MRKNIEFEKANEASLKIFDSMHEIIKFLNRVQIHLFFGKSINLKDIPKNKKKEWEKAHGKKFFHKKDLLIWQKPL